MLELDKGDDCGIRYMAPVYMLKAGNELQAVKFCMRWLDEFGGVGGGGVVGGGGMSVGGVDLGLDMVQGRYVRAAMKNPRFAFLVAVGCWKMFCAVAGGALVNGGCSGGGGIGGGRGGGRGITGGGGLYVCRSARAWLRLGHKSNRHVLRILLTMITHKSTYIGPTGYLNTSASSSAPGTVGGPDSYEEANDFIFSTSGLLLDEADNIPRWLCDTAHMWVLNTCPGCGTREAKVGEHKACMGCRGEWYCGVECQRRSWEGHKRRCVEVRKDRKMRALMGRPSWGGAGLGGVGVGVKG